MGKRGEKNGNAQKKDLPRAHGAKEGPLVGRAQRAQRHDVPPLRGYDPELQRVPVLRFLQKQASCQDQIRGVRGQRRLLLSQPRQLLPEFLLALSQARGDRDLNADVKVSAALIVALGEPLAP